MAKEWFFYDSTGTRRRVKAAYFYDSAGNSKSITKGYFYDAQGVRRQFFVGGLPLPPPPADYANANFTIKSASYVGGDGKTYSGYSKGQAGTINPVDPRIPCSTDPSADTLMLARRNDTANGIFTLIYTSKGTSPVLFPFWQMVVLDQNNNPYAVNAQSAAVFQDLGSSQQWEWTYLPPLTAGSQYKFQFHNMVRSDTLTAGLLPAGGGTGFDSTTGTGSIGQLNVRTAYIIRLVTVAEDLELTLGGFTSDPGRYFIAGINIDASGFGFKSIMDLVSYTYDSGTGRATWLWDETTAFVPAQQYPFQTG